MQLQDIINFFANFIHDPELRKWLIAPLAVILYKFWGREQLNKIATNAVETKIEVINFRMQSIEKKQDNIEKDNKDIKSTLQELLSITKSIQCENGDLSKKIAEHEALLFFGKNSPIYKNIK